MRPTLTMLAALACLAAPALAQAPTSEALWRQQPPPFRSYVDGFAGGPRPGAAMETRLGVVPWFLPPQDASPERRAALEQAASHVAARYAAIGLRAPRLTRRDGAYPLYLVRDLGAAAAQYGPGYGDVGTTELLRISRGDWERVIAIGEADGFGADLAIYPEKVAASAAHELFHGVQASYASWSGHDNQQAHEEKWVTEALPDAIGLWAIEGLAFLGQPPFDPVRRFASGSRRYGKALGLRPYDYPLDLRRVPPRLPIYPAGAGEDEIRQMASYLSNSFWTYVWQASLPAGKAWTPMSRALLLRTPARGTASVREDALAWTDRSLREGHPAWRRGLFDAFPAFIAWWVAYPDIVMGSRQGEFAHERWLQHAFVDGCMAFTLDEATPTVSFDLAVRELAAQCVRVKWTGASAGASGSPAAALVATPADGGGAAALDDLHLGLHGSALGRQEVHVDAGTGLPARAWSGLSLDPLYPASTQGETVFTFTNVARDALATQRRTFHITIGVATGQAQGSLEAPAEPSSRLAASRVSVPARRRALPTRVAAMDPGDRLDLAVTPAPEAGKDDCLNATAKTAGDGLAAGAAAAGRVDAATVCLAMAAGATRASLRPPRQPEVELELPVIASGQVGPVEGASVRVSWDDPGRGGRGDEHIDARSRDVRLQVDEATPAFVRGRFQARFDAARDGASGELAGNFLAWRADVRERLPLADPLDSASGDLLQRFAATGRDPLEMRASLTPARPARRPAAAAATAATDACPTDCEAYRAGHLPPDCRVRMAAFYAGCDTTGEATGPDELRSLAERMFEAMPEPMRSEMVEQTLEGVMAMPEPLRKDWARKLRAAQGRGD